MNYLKTDGSECAFESSPGFGDEVAVVGSHLPWIYRVAPVLKDATQRKKKKKQAIPIKLVAPARVRSEGIVDIKVISIGSKNKASIKLGGHPYILCQIILIAAHYPSVLCFAGIQEGVVEDLKVADAGG